ncbi:hypothetical protein [Geodermatophilus telluris]|uniref:hypothetical protein n=1 Tax=Geodermatophilus telluris TaxID=1190417 RepID=UPI000B839AEE|nr:hypothetical protein [Geodermatophilus telluris]
MAQGDRRSHGLLAPRGVRGGAGQYAEPVVQPGQHRGRWEHGGARGGQLERQGQALQPATDVGDRPGVLPGQRKVRAPGLRPAQEELDRGVGGQHLDRCRRRGRRSRQRADGELATAAQAQAHLAGDQDDELGAAGGQVGHGCGGPGDALEVVQHEQHEQHGPLGECAGEDVEIPPRSVGGETECAADRSRQQRRIGLRRQRHPDRPVGEARREPSGRLQGQPGLADPAGAGQGQDPDVAAGQDVDDGRELPFPTDQRARGRGWCPRPRRHARPVRSGAGRPRQHAALHR